MIRRFLSLLALVAVTFFLTAMGARAATISIEPDGSNIVLTAGNIYKATEESDPLEPEQTTGDFHHVYTFDIAAGSNLGFQGGGVDPAEFLFEPQSGLSLLHVDFTRLGSSLVGYPISDASDPGEFLVDAIGLAFVVLEAAVTYVLTISGDYTAPAQYVFSFQTVSTSESSTPTVPIPPAALLFLTALFGVGWLGRRKARVTPA